MPNPSPAGPQTPPSRRFTDSTASGTTLIGAHTRLKGDLQSEDTVDIEGVVDGTCRVGGLCRVRSGAKVNGDVTAASIVVEGEVQGASLEARKVEIGASARVRADVRAPVVAIAEGGFLEGHVHMDREGTPVEPVRFKEKRQPSPEEPAPGS